MKKLLVLTNEFPYGSIEPYLETEEKYYNGFEKIWIASLQVRKEHMKTRRNINSDAKVIPVRYKSKFFYFVNSLSVLGDISLYRELRYLFREHKFSVHRLVDLFVFLSRAHHEARIVNRKIAKKDRSDIVIYSYRFEYQPYVAMLLKKKWGTNNEIVSRAHRYDLYEEHRISKYIPLRRTLLNGVNYVFPCSENGTDYIAMMYGKNKAIVETSYLGTLDYGEHEYSFRSSENGVFNIVSCSNVVEVKHVEKIIDALVILNKKLGDESEKKYIKWTHFGDGILLNKMKTRAKVSLGNGNTLIQYEFMGNIQNKELMKWYTKENYYLFINVSSSEGLPVSIMEAMSFGIPCIATNVGGTKEIINEYNGILLDKNVEAKEIAQAIERLIYMKPSQYLKLRIAAREDWNKKFNAEHNYKQFIGRMTV